MNKKAQTSLEVHILGTVHLQNPLEIIALLNTLRLDNQSLFFDELNEQRWRNPFSIPPFEHYIRVITSYLAKKRASIVPMGHEDMLYPTFEQLGDEFVNVARGAEDIYMVEHVLVPILNENRCSKAIVNLGLMHVDRFFSELEKHGYKPTLPVLCEYSPVLDCIKSLQDFAEGRRSTFLTVGFLEEFFAKTLNLMGIDYLSPPYASHLLASQDAEFVAGFRKIAQQLFADEKMYERHTKVPEQEFALAIKDTYLAAKQRCDEMRAYAIHPVIPAKSLVEDLR